MCGIVGYVGRRPCRDLLVAGLSKLEYRGYDSAGISLLHDGHIDSIRAVAHLIERNYDGDLSAAVAGAFATLRGHYAFVAMHADHPATLVAARQECPLVIGLGDGET